MYIEVKKNMEQLILFRKYDFKLFHENSLFLVGILECVPLK